MRCSKHNEVKKYLFCLENECVDRLECELCIVQDKKHHEHKFILIGRMMDENCDTEMKKLFGDTYDEMVENDEQKNVEGFIRAFDRKFDKYLVEKEAELREPVEKMIDGFRKTAMRWKKI